MGGGGGTQPKATARGRVREGDMPLLRGVRSSILQSEWEAKKRSIAAIILLCSTNNEENFRLQVGRGGGGATAPPAPHLNTAL